MLSHITGLATAVPRQSLPRGKCIAVWEGFFLECNHCFYSLWPCKYWNILFRPFLSWMSAGFRLVMENIPRGPMQRELTSQTWQVLHYFFCRRKLSWRTFCHSVCYCKFLCIPLEMVTRSNINRNSVGLISRHDLKCSLFFLKKKNFLSLFFV